MLYLERWGMSLKIGLPYYITDTAAIINPRFAQEAEKEISLNKAHFMQIIGDLYSFLSEFDEI